MARPVKANEFATAYEYEQAKKQERKQAQGKRHSPNGRKGFSLKTSDE
jgi:hypothetical protein